MKDIDFDELDRAVHSATQGDNKHADEKKVESEETADVSVKIVSSPVRPPVSLATRRSSGRFMDVVHPSSDMRTKVSAANNEHDSSRNNVPKDQTDNTPAGSEEEAWPDPIDFQEEHTDAKNEDDVTDLIDMSPLESPFLTDAKVEKRPLGAFSGDTPPESEEPKDVLEEVSDIFEDEPTEEISEPIEKKDGVVEEDELLLLPESTHDEEKEEPAVEAEQPIGPVSITQQYTEQPSTAEQSTTMIFDTDEYKKPLAHPKKKSSGWLIILWIIILLIVGAGAGAAIYFYVLPLL